MLNVIQMSKKKGLIPFRRLNAIQMFKKKGLMPVLDAECDSNVQEEGFNARFGC
jgi:hypothetical protein